MKPNAIKQPILHLVLTKKWFDMMGNPKTEEYREITPYWSRVFSRGQVKIKGIRHAATDVVVCFSLGYASDRPQRFFYLRGLKIQSGGVPEWGAKPDTMYFVLLIGDEINTL